MKIIRITNKNLAIWQSRIQELESLSSYPLGNDFFRIDHGNNYLAFFNRLGKTQFYAAVENNKVLAVAAGVLRTIKHSSSSDRTIRTWYLCDLKVHPAHRGRKIPLKLFSRAFLHNYLKCQKMYAITMDGEDPTKVARLLGRFKWAPLKITEKLNFYNLSYEQINQLSKELECHLGPISYLSLAGTKDLILQSTSKPLPLLHIQHGLISNIYENDSKQNTKHMMCLPKNHMLCNILQSFNISVYATATVLQRGMDNFNWDFILTSDI